MDNRRLYKRYLDPESDISCGIPRQTTHCRKKLQNAHVNSVDTDSDHKDVCSNNEDNNSSLEHTRLDLYDHDLRRSDDYDEEISDIEMSEHDHFEGQISSTLSSVNYSHSSNGNKNSSCNHESISMRYTTMNDLNDSPTADDESNQDNSFDNEDIDQNRREEIFVHESNDEKLPTDSYLSEHLCPCTTTSRGEALLMCLSLGMRHSLPWVAVIDQLKMINLLFGKKVVPESKYMLRKYFSADITSVKYHLYCSACKKYLGDRSDLGDTVECACSLTHKTSEVTSFFLELDFESQLQNLFKNETVAKNLKYRFEREKRTDQNLEDIYDGEMYRKFSDDDRLLGNEWNFSYTFNTDGCQAADSSRVTIWPIFVMIHELPPKMRSRHMILVGLWIDKTEPIMNIFLEPFVKQANRLSSAGFKCQINENEVITRKAFPLLCCVDSVARPAMLNMKQFNGTYGCTFCEHPTERVGGVRKYTVSTKIPLDRTNDIVKQNMIEADTLDNGMSVNGVWGPSSLMNLEYFDLVRGMDVDYMHCGLLGVIRQYTENILSSVGAEFYVGDPHSLSIIKDRLFSFSPPKCITRRPRDITERRLWKASEWRSWLIFYSLLCLRGLLPQRYLRHLALLVTAINILLQNCITPRMLQNAEKSLITFVVQFQKLFGKEAMTYNVHLLLHVATGVRNWGPLWAHNAFPFENQNRCLLQMKKSPTRLATQIVQRLLFYQSMGTVADKISISENVSTFCAAESEDKLRYFSKLNRCVLIGSGKDYVLNAEEVACIGYTVHERCKAYEKIIYNSIRYTISSYKRNININDSVVELENNGIGVIEKICKVNTGTGEKIVIFIRKVDREPGPYLSGSHVKVTHICQCYIRQDGDLCSYDPESLRIPSILVYIDGAFYVCRIPRGCLGD